MGGSTKKLSLTQTIQYWLSKCRLQWEDMDQGECALKGTCRRIPSQGVMVEVQLGGKNGCTLHVYPDHALTNDPAQLETALLIVNPDNFFTKSGGFLRLLAGQGVVLGRHDTNQSLFFQFPPDVASRHLTLIHQGEHLLIKDLASDYGSFIRLHTQAEFVARLPHGRLQQLRQLIAMYGNTFSPLPPQLAMERLQQAHQNLHLACSANQEPLAPAMDKNQQPCPPVIRLSALTVAIIIGDLHGRLNNLLTLLTLGGFLERLATKKTTLVILGDAIHLDEGKNLTDMDSSIIMMDLIFTLMIHFPGQVVYLRGNHDGFSEDISKGGVSQGAAWNQALIKLRGEAYRNAMLAFYQDLPYIVVHPCFIACHAGPPMDAVDADTLLNLRQHPKLIRQLTWSRVAKSNRTTGYGAKHVQKFRESIGVHKKTPLLVGHDLLDHDNTIWLNAGHIEDHHVLYGSHPKRIGWITFIDNELITLEYPVEPLLSLAESLPT